MTLTRPLTQHPPHHTVGLSSEQLRGEWERDRAGENGAEEMRYERQGGEREWKRRRGRQQCGVFFGGNITDGSPEVAQCELKTSIKSPVIFDSICILFQNHIFIGYTAWTGFQRQRIAMFSADLSEMHRKVKKNKCVKSPELIVLYLDYSS